MRIAGILLKRNKPGDRAEVDMLLKQAQEIAETMRLPEARKIANFRKQNGL